MTKADAEISEESDANQDDSDEDFVKAAVSELPHLLEKRINDPWNQVLFEVKLLRDYFVDESVLPKFVA